MKFNTVPLTRTKVTFTFHDMEMIFVTDKDEADISETDIKSYLVNRTRCIRKWDDCEIDLLESVQNSCYGRFLTIKVSREVWDSIKEGNGNQIDDYDEILTIMNMLWEDQ